jgi:hypothetical protein
VFIGKAFVTVAQQQQKAESDGLNESFFIAEGREGFLLQVA